MPSSHEGIDDSEGDRSNQGQDDECRDGCHCPLDHENDHGAKGDLDVGDDNLAIVCRHAGALLTAYGLILFRHIPPHFLQLHPVYV